MKSRYSHVLMLLGAILAFVPILAVDYLLDSYVRVRERDNAVQRAAAISAQIRLNVEDARLALNEVLADSPSLCTPTFVGQAQRKVEKRLLLKDILVENQDGVQYCDAFGRTITYVALSETLPIPGQPETLTVVKLGDMAMPVLKVSLIVGQTRTVSSFVPLLGQSAEAIKAAIEPTAMLRVMLTNGKPILTSGDPTGFDNKSDPDSYIAAQDYAGELPLKTEFAQPFAIARSGYADLDVSFTTVAALMSASFLLLALHYVRRMRAPAFDLERAIARGEIKPYYQPVINLRTGALMGCEVLCRWEKKKGKVIPPGVFIDYAESTGLAIPMTLSLMQQVKADLGEICRDQPELKVSINLFEGHFRDTSIVEDVQAIFGHSPISFRQLVFEITERHPLANSTVATSVIAGLHALGSKIALDDAGTGHSNLAYMATLGVDIIKIDRVFVDMVKPGTTQVPVLDGLIAMAHDLDCDVVAEGVETEEQALYLRSHGVVQAQGFIFAPALRVGAFKQLALALKPAVPSAAPEIAPRAQAA